ncbi:tRNA (adenosine(37)-N6)-dimethylallyltransferase MiaA [Zooshikella marina]|uniref:tRNA (adenosine(37)-N6)-dimethylallyltransferase MiaA n=1 Tax=Zooshikella ganghwensis TaxID=202772 RepID=UPI001BB030FD|nr:tRNA (adenosine(37)-N6)-dimethylallyltransferase MiaA [Zooshikella ganghwensis]MBU2708277.1 tRNA (adenosine(37)-N6)-dimethylallyltransferase MiaA [Zooshikella ganghwensis]
MPSSLDSTRFAAVHNNPDQINLIVVLGPTASGKTHLAVQLAGWLQGEIISADSRQVYRGMDIGSGKDLEEYGSCPYHLIDIVNPGDEYNVHRYQRDCFSVIQGLWQKNSWPVMVGGTGLYIESVINGYRFVDIPENPELDEELKDLSIEQLQQRLLTLSQHRQQPLHNSSDLQHRARLEQAIKIAEAELAGFSVPKLPTINPLLIGIRWDRPTLRKRITERLMQRLNNGMIEEVEGLLQQGVTHEMLDWCGLEYRFVSLYLQNQLNFNDMKQKLNSQIHQFAKRQDTWFRRMERQGWTIHWLEAKQDITQQLQSVLTQNQLYMP